MGLPAVRRTGGLAGSASSLALWRVPIRNVGHRRHHLPGQSSATDDLVSGHMARHQPEERHQRFGITACFGPGQLQDRLGDAAQIASGDGSPGSRSIVWRRRSGRDLLGWRGNRRNWPTDGAESPDYRRCPGRWERHWSNPSAPHPGFDPGQFARVHRPDHRAGQHSPNRRFARLPGVERICPRPPGSAPPSARRTPAPAGPSGGFAPEAMATGHSSRRCWTRSSGLLPRRIHLPLQPSQVGVPRQAVLSLGSTGRPAGPGPVCNLDQTATHWVWWRQVNIPIGNCLLRSPIVTLISTSRRVKRIVVVPTYNGMTDASATQMVKLFDFHAPKLGVLTVNNMHNMEHYGNLVTYMRMKGVVPPPSEPASQPQPKK